MSANCVIDRDVLNAETYPDFTEIGLSVFAPLCGKNRGAFVLNPTDGHTWGCAEFPPSFAKLANVHHHVTIKDSNAIGMQYNGGNITAIEVRTDRSTYVCACCLCLFRLVYVCALLFVYSR